MLKVSGVTYRYPKCEKPVLQDFSAQFERGKIWAITGPNGSGKTTLGKIIMGILKPEKGTVSILTKSDFETSVDAKCLDLSQMTLAEIGKKIGYVMQTPSHQIFSLSVGEEVAYGLRNLRLPEEEVQRRTRQFLGYFDLQNRMDEFPLFLSQGEKQRLVLAAVLAMKPDWLLLDEPTTSLDFKRRQQLGEYLTMICSELTTGVILISHDRKFADKYCQGEQTMEGGSHV